MLNKSPIINIAKKTTYYPNNLLFFLFSFLLLILTKCQSDESQNFIVIPFKTYFPTPEGINQQGIIMNKWTRSKTYFETENPNKQKMQIILTSSDENLMYTRNNVTSIRTDEEHYKPYSENIGDICSFDYKNSSSYNFYDCTRNFHSMDSNNCYAKEKIKLYSDTDLKESKFYEIHFIHTTNESGVCFLGNTEISSAVFDKIYNFIYQLKNLTNSKSYTWTLKYTSPEEGYFIFGDIIGNNKITFYNDNIEENYYSITMASIIEKIFWRTQITKIYIGNNRLYNTANKDYLYVHLDFYSRYITVPYNDSLEFKNIFDLNQEYCFNTKVEYYFNAIYCDKKKYLTLTDNYKNLPTISFFGELQINITFTPKDLFIEKDDKIYFLIAYDEHRDTDWYFGNIFLQKYTVVFNNDARTMNVLKKVNFEDDGSNTLKIVLIVILCIILSGLIFGFLGVKYGKVLFEKRRKKANELDDDEYDYVQKNDIKDSSPILGNGIN